ncbi:MAG: GlxA family transcriptional regulator [Hyphomicrobiales bacterium]
MAFILFPKFSMIGLTGLLEPLRLVNRYAGVQEFGWTFVSIDGAPVSASNGIPVSAGFSMAEMARPDIALFCASYEADRNLAPQVLACARKLARQGTVLGGVDSAQVVLAASGVLDGYRAATHWEITAGMRETYPDIEISDAAYEIDRDRLTAATGAGAIDMMLDYISRILGPRESLYAAEQLGHRPVPGATSEARLPPDVRCQVTHPKLIKIMRLMEENAEDVLSNAELSAVTDISIRQMERLFATHVGESPRRFYRRLRLERAERLLTYSKLNVTEAAIACGFTSVAEFSRSYKAHFGDPPTRHRRRDISPGLY